MSKYSIGISSNNKYHSISTVGSHAYPSLCINTAGKRKQHQYSRLETQHDCVAPYLVANGDDKSSCEGGKGHHNAHDNIHKCTQECAEKYR